MKLTHILHTLSALALTLLAAACNQPEARLPEQSTVVQEAAQIYPDYRGIVIPPNIAPLNIQVRSAGTAYVGCIEGAGRQLLAAASADGKLCFDSLEWRGLLEANRGRDLTVTLYARRDSGWVRFPAYTLTVAGAASTGYLNAFFVAMLSIPMLWLAIARKNGRAAVAVVLAPLAAVAVAFAAYQGYFNFLLHSNVHTNRAFESFSGIPEIIFVNTLYRDVLTLPGAILLGAMLLIALMSRERVRMVQTCRQWWIPLCAIAAMVLVEYASLLREERYIFPYLSSAALLAGVIISGIDDRLRNASAIVLGLYMLAMCPFTSPKKIYGWDYVRGLLKEGAVLYRLNPNELPQIAPVLNDTARYRLATDSAGLAASGDLPVVSRVKPPLGSIAKKQRLTGPLDIYSKQMR